MRGADTRHTALLPPLPRDFRAICGKKNSYQGTADYADEKDTADEEKPHQRRTEGSQSAYIRVHLWLKRTVARGTADYADEKDTADEWKEHQ
ncbi:MAG: hypothetical protein LBD08_00005 [Treponema sp.]|nr:hypothetical protein [Treponema sp.]